MHQIRFGNIYMVTNKYIPKFKDTVIDLDKKHPALTISTRNNEGLSVLCPGTKNVQKNNKKVLHIKPGQGSGLAHDTYFFLKLRFPLSENTVRNLNVVKFIGRATPSKLSELERKFSYRYK